MCRFGIDVFPKATPEAAVLSAFVLDARGMFSTNGEDSNFELIHMHWEILIIMVL